MRTYSTSVTLMFREFAPLERFAKAREAGFEHVEIQALEAAPSLVADAAAAAGVAIHLLNVGMGDFIQGGPGLIGNPGCEQRFREECRKAIDLATQAGIPFVHLGAGRVPESVSREACMAVLLDNVRAAIEMVRGSPVSLLLEPLNLRDTPNALLGDIDETADMIRTRFAGDIGLMYDIYHVAQSGRDLVATYRRHSDLIRHIQFSDAPGRHEPGTGQIDFAGVIADIEGAGYTGVWGAEYFPSGATMDSFAWKAQL